MAYGYRPEFIVNHRPYFTHKMKTAIIKTHWNILKEVCNMFCACFVHAYLTIISPILQLKETSSSPSSRERRIHTSRNEHPIIFNRKHLCMKPHWVLLEKVFQMFMTKTFFYFKAGQQTMARRPVNSHWIITMTVMCKAKHSHIHTVRINSVALENFYLNMKI